MSHVDVLLDLGLKGAARRKCRIVHELLLGVGATAGRNLWQERSLSNDSIAPICQKRVPTSQACESPVKTSVRVAVGSPNTQVESNDEDSD
jgi:hypothetical protein